MCCTFNDFINSGNNSDNIIDENFVKKVKFSDKGNEFIKCPSCNSIDVSRTGLSRKGEQRLICNSCSLSFNPTKIKCSQVFDLVLTPSQETFLSEFLKNLTNAYNFMVKYLIENPDMCKRSNLRQLVLNFFDLSGIKVEYRNKEIIIDSAIRKVSFLLKNCKTSSFQPIKFWNTFRFNIRNYKIFADNTVILHVPEIGGVSLGETINPQIFDQVTSGVIINRNSLIKNWKYPDINRKIVINYYSDILDTKKSNYIHIPNISEISNISDNQNVCPHCGDSDCIKSGKFRNHPLFQCNSCSTYFRIEDKESVIVSNPSDKQTEIQDISHIDKQNHWLSIEEFNNCDAGWYFIKDKNGQIPRTVKFLLRVNNFLGYLENDNFQTISFENQDIAGPIPLPK